MYSYAPPEIQSDLRHTTTCAIASAYCVHSQHEIVYMPSITFENVTDLRDSIKQLKVNAMRLTELADFFEFILSDEIDTYLSEHHPECNSESVKAIALGQKKDKHGNSLTKHSISDLIVYADNICSERDAKFEHPSITFDLHYDWMSKYARAWVSSCVVE